MDLQSNEFHEWLVEFLIQRAKTMGVKVLCSKRLANGCAIPTREFQRMQSDVVVSIASYVDCFAVPSKTTTIHPRYFIDIMRGDLIDERIGK